MSALLAALTAWGGVDAQLLQSTDGGRYPALMEPDLGLENTLAATVTMHVGKELVVLRDSTGDTVIVDQVTTQDLHISMNLFDSARIGVGLPRHKPLVLEGVTQQRAYAGDFVVFVQGPLATGERVRSTLSAQLDLPLGSEAVWLGDQDPALQVITSIEARTGRLTTLVNLGPRLSRTVSVPGMRWGNHWVWGLGSRWEPYGPLGLTGELFGRTPLNPIRGAPGSYPAELLSTIDVRLGPATLGFGGGRGLTRGLGSPSFRVLGRLDVRPHRRVDRDGDGIGDLRDVCPTRPEDLDSFRDQDGCPDEDNDEDGLLDAVDSCPDAPETFNGWRDRDGCPDTHAELEVVLVPEDHPAVRLVWQGRERVVEAGRPAIVDVDAGSVEMVATAAGFLEARAVELVPEGATGTVTLVLEPVPIARVRLRPTDPDGVAIVAAIDGETVPEGGRWEELEVGPYTARVSAPGFFPALVEVDLVPGEQEVDVVLQPASLDAQVGFELDSDTLTDEALAYLESLRAYLDAHPDLVLVRVEGEADDQGTSAYNYKLSTARATRVRDWLVEHGIDPARLQAIGSGEASAEERQVRFRVLIWD